VTSTGSSDEAHRPSAWNNFPIGIQIGFGLGRVIDPLVARLADLANPVPVDQALLLQAGRTNSPAALWALFDTGLP
jgi:hypothetical protein